MSALSTQSDTEGAEPTEPTEPTEPAVSGPASPIRRMSLWPPPRSARHNRRRKGPMLLLVGVLLAVVAGGGFLLWYGFGYEPTAVGIAPEDAEEFAGTWHGDMVQVDAKGEHVVDWSARVEIDTSGESGAARWVTFGCAGDLTLVSATSGRLVLDYTETEDPDDRCVETATLTLTSAESDESELRAEWVAITREGTEMTSTGTMR